PAGPFSFPLPGGRSRPPGVHGGPPRTSRGHRCWRKRKPMRTKLGIIALAGLVTLGGQAALAGKPTPPPADPAIAYEAWTNKGTVNLMVMDRDGSNQEVLVTDGYNPTWSPDGSQLAFSTGSSRPKGIYVVNR